MRPMCDDHPVDHGSEIARNRLLGRLLLEDPRRGGRLLAHAGKSANFGDADAHAGIRWEPGESKIIQSLERGNRCTHASLLAYAARRFRKAAACSRISDFSASAWLANSVAAART
jgi:hypothetical protein